MNKILILIYLGLAKSLILLIALPLILGTILSGCSPNNTTTSEVQVPLQAPVAQKTLAPTASPTAFSEFNQPTVTASPTVPPTREPTKTIAPQEKPTLSPQDTTISSTVPFLEVLSDVPLRFDETTPLGAQLRADVGPDHRLVVLGWTDHNEIVVRPGFKDELMSSESLTSTLAAQWAISPKTGQVRFIDDKNYLLENELKERIISEIKKSVPKELGKTGLPIPVTCYLSPDNEIAVVSHSEKQLHVYRTGNAIPKTVLPTQKLKYNFIYAKGDIIWSNGGNRFAYPVATTDVDAYQEYPDASLLRPVYQIHISDWDGSNLIQLNLPWPSGIPRLLDWSQNDRFLAFAVQIEEKGPEHIIVYDIEKQIWNDLTPQVDPLLEVNYLFWSPDGTMLVYGFSLNGTANLMELKVE